MARVSADTIAEMRDRHGYPDGSDDVIASTLEAQWLELANRVSDLRDAAIAALPWRHR